MASMGGWGPSPSGYRRHHVTEQRLSASPVSSCVMYMAQSVSETPHSLFAHEIILTIPNVEVVAVALTRQPRSENLDHG